MGRNLLQVDICCCLRNCGYILRRGLGNKDEGQDVPESVIEAFVVKIVVSKDGFDWYLRFDGDPDKPLHCQLQGKRKQTTKIMVAGDISPTVNNGTTGCYQRLRGVPSPLNYRWDSKKLQAIARPMAESYEKINGGIPR